MRWKTIAGIFGLSVSLFGCSTHRVIVMKGAVHHAPLPKGAPFLIVGGDPPRDAEYVGKMSLYSEAFYASNVIEEIREKARLAGANLLCNLRCDGVSTYIVEDKGNVKAGPPILARSSIHCSGRLFRVGR